MNEFERVTRILNVRSFGRSMDHYVHPLVFQREPFDALR